MDDATLGLLVLLSVPVAFALLILVLRLHNRRSASRASHTEFHHSRGSYAERRREIMTRAQQQVPFGRGGAEGIM
ncbi:hypothetical protein C2W62_43280 [Candidatus Entotheonella serta]|nr:hypothetical protein C2W62_43280 [Candidatus Entotheonella serta]